MNRFRLMLVLFLMLSLSVTAWVGPSAGPPQVAALEGSNPVYLPLVMRCGITPPPPPPSPLAVLRITPDQPNNASTFNPNSFVLRNESADGSRLQSLTLDLSTGLLPDVVFDPFGGAGDQVAKGFTLDSVSGDVDVAFSYADAHDGGFFTLTLTFDSFDPGDQIGWSIDIDPTSIKGGSSPGPGESGSVSGLEMSGATIEAAFVSADGMTTTEIIARTYAPPGTAAESRADIRAGLPSAPALSVAGVADPAVVAAQAQLVYVDAPPEAQVTLFVFDATLYTEGLPDGGFDIDPFEANNVDGTASIQTGQTGCFDGQIAFPVLLSDAPGRTNYLVAFVNQPAYGLTGAMSNVVKLDWEP